jgi:hypothetical protein
MARSKLSNQEKVIFVPSIANQAAPTQAELNAGVALCTPGTAIAEGLVALTNFESRTTFIGVGDAAQDFDAQIPGRKSAGEPMLEFYDGGTTTTNRTALAEGSSGYIVRCFYGQTTGKRCAVFPVTIGAQNDSMLNNQNESFRFFVAVAITAAPTKNAVIAA